MANQINKLAITYNDFKINEVLDPEQFDTNNREIQDTVNQTVDVVNVLTQSVADGNSGADNVGATPIGGGTSTTVQGIMEEMNTNINNVTLGQLPPDVLQQLPNKEQLSDIITNGIIKDKLNELNVTETDVPSQAVKVDTGKANVETTVYTYETPTTLAIDPHDIIEITNEQHTTDANGHLEVFNNPISNADGSDFATADDVTTVKASDGSAVNITYINGRYGVIITDAPNEIIKVTYKHFNNRKDVVYVNDEGAIAVQKGNLALPNIQPSTPNIPNGVALGDITLPLLSEDKKVIPSDNIFASNGFITMYGSDEKTMYGVRFYGDYLYVLKSTDDGDTWQQLSSTIVKSLNEQSTKATIDSNDVIHVVMRAKVASGDAKYSIMYSKFKDNVLTAPVKINTQNQSTYNQIETDIIVDNNNKLHVVWTGYSAAINIQHLMYRSSSDGGDTWGTVYDFPDTNHGNTDNPKLFFDKLHNTIYVVLCANTLTNNYRPVIFIKSTDGGNTWSAIKQLSPDGTVRLYYPQIYKDKFGTLHVVYSKGNTSMEYVKSTDDGDTWTTPMIIPIPGGSGTILPFDLICDDVGVLYLVWGSESTDDIYISSLLPNISTWNDAVLCYNGISVSFPYKCYFTQHDLPLKGYGLSYVDNGLAWFKSTLKYNKLIKEITNDNITNNNIYTHISGFNPIEVEGHIEINKTLQPLEEFTYSIPLGKSNYKNGKLTFGMYQGYSVFFGIIYITDDINKTIALGANQDRCLSVDKSIKGFIGESDTTHAIGNLPFSGTNYIYLKYAYINVDKIELCWKNTHNTTVYTIQTGITWEV